MQARHPDPGSYLKFGPSTWWFCLIRAILAEDRVGRCVCRALVEPAVVLGASTSFSRGLVLFFEISILTEASMSKKYPD